MKKIERLQVVVAGNICFDVIPAFKKTDKVKMDEIFVPGKLINMGSVMVSTGGPVSNTGIALSILGINIKLMFLQMKILIECRACVEVRYK